MQDHLDEDIETINAPNWDEAIGFYMGKEVVIETHDGIYSEGKLTKINTFSIQVGSETVPIPVTVELDHDVEKCMDISRMISIKAPDSEQE